MMLIKKPYLTRENGQSRLTFLFVNHLGEEKELYFAVESSLEKYLTCDRADAALVGLFPDIVRHGGEVVCEAPLSKMLKFNLEHNLSPVLPKFHKSFSKLKITAPTIDDKFPEEGRKVGTGCSCGIDSLSTIALHTAEDTPEDLKVDMLAFFNVGSNGEFSKIKSEEGRAKVAKLYKARFAAASNCAKDLGLPIITLDSNLHEFGDGLGHLYISTYRTCAAVLALGRLFKAYHFASSERVNRFHLDLEAEASDLFLLKCFSTENTTLHSAALALARYERTELVAANSTLAKHVDVCIHEAGKNCGKCAKCLRTLFQAEQAGVLDKIEDAFDMSFYRANHRKVMKILAKDVDFHNEFFEQNPNLSWGIRLTFAIGRIKVNIKRFRKWLKSNLKTSRK